MPRAPRRSHIGLNGPFDPCTTSRTLRSLTNHNPREPIAQGTRPSARPPSSAMEGGGPIRRTPRRQAQPSVRPTIRRRIHPNRRRPGWPPCTTHGGLIITGCMMVEIRTYEHTKTRIQTQAPHTSADANAHAQRSPAQARSPTDAACTHAQCTHDYLVHTHTHTRTHTCTHAAHTGTHANASHTHVHDIYTGTARMYARCMQDTQCGHETRPQRARRAHRIAEIIVANLASKVHG